MKSLEQLIKDYGNACYANDDDLTQTLEREILSRLNPIGYIPQHSAATIKREGLWDACTLYRTKVDPTDVEVFL